MYYVPMTNSKSAPETEPEAEVTGYGYLTDAEREAAIAAHAEAVAANSKG